MRRGRAFTLFSRYVLFDLAAIWLLILSRSYHRLIKRDFLASWRRKFLAKRLECRNRCTLKKCFDSDKERSIFRRKVSGSKYLEITKSLIVMYVYVGLKERYGIPQILESPNNMNRDSSGDLVTYTDLTWLLMLGMDVAHERLKAVG